MENENSHNEDWLSKLPKDSGFEVPEGYFDTVEDQFSARLREESLPNDAGFEVPNDYFDSIEERIMSQLETPKTGKVISLRSRILRVASIAAIFALLLTAYFYPISSATEPTSDEIAAWMEENIGAMEASDFIAALDEDSFLEVSILDDSYDTNIEKYLDENDTYILIEESPGVLDETFEDNI